MRIKLISIPFILFACSQSNSKKTVDTDNFSNDNVKEELLSLERKWLDAEFVLDTAYVSTLMDSTFIDISTDHISNKQQALKGMYNNISAMRRDSIFLDSLKFEEITVNLYENVAVITLVTHSYKKNKGKPTEKRMRFYDVWLNRNGTWKAVSSQGTSLTE
ncbi:MAG TPA: nuclear transport factor 2 family protein [Chitinophagaceae bacterium]|nr:nuclear transport factor 2 family protein [Chitinophagaceae bacterium]